MIDYSNLRLMHYHGDEAVEMAESDAPHHDAAAHDLERRIGWHRRVFRCTTCDEEVVVDAPTLVTGRDEPARDDEERQGLGQAGLG